MERANADIELALNKLKTEEASLRDQLAKMQALNEGLAQDKVDLHKVIAEVTLAGACCEILLALCYAIWCKLATEYSKLEINNLSLFHFLKFVTDSLKILIPCLNNRRKYARKMK